MAEVGSATRIPLLRVANVMRTHFAFVRITFPLLWCIPSMSRCLDCIPSMQVDASHSADIFSSTPRRRYSSPMPTSLNDALDELRTHLTNLDTLVKAVASGKRRGEEPPPRVDLRPVDLKSGPHLQTVTATDAAPLTTNTPASQLGDHITDLLTRPYGNWHIETTTLTIQMRVTKKGDAQLHTRATSTRSVAPRTHNRTKNHIIDADDPLFAVLGAGADKRRQVDAFLRIAAPTLDALAAETDGPLSAVDLGCGNAYLTFAAHRYLCRIAPGSTTIGIEARQSIVDTSTNNAKKAGLDGLTFIAGRIDEISLDDMDLPGNRLDIAMALHACDTATDDALATAIASSARVILAAPCCHHDLQKQWGKTPPTPAGFAPIVGSPILKERFADVITDAARATILRTHGYNVDVVEFVDSRHTPRNAMIRATHTGTPCGAAASELGHLTATWNYTPRLQQLTTPQST